MLEASCHLFVVNVFIGGWPGGQASRFLPKNSRAGSTVQRRRTVHRLRGSHNPKPKVLGDPMFPAEVLFLDPALGFL